MLKVWISLKFEFYPLIPQQFTLSIKAKISPINNQRQQLFTPEPIKIDLKLAYTCGSTSSTKTFLIQIPLI